MPEQLYYFDEATKQYKIAEKENAMMAIVKLTKQKEDVEQRLEQTEKIIESRLAMFETLLRTELSHTCSEIDDVRSDTKELAANLKAQIELWANGVIEKQKLINSQTDNKLNKLHKDIQQIDERLSIVETRDTRKKAKRWDLVAVAFGSGFLTWFIQFIIKLITSTTGG